MKTGRALAAMTSLLLLSMLTLSACATRSHMHGDRAMWELETERRIESLEKSEQPVVREERARPSRRSAVPEGYGAAWMALPSGSEASSVVLVEKMVPERVVAGSPYRSYIVVTNLSDNLVLQDVVVADTFHNGYTLASSTPAPASSNASGATWRMEQLGPGEQVRITLEGGSDAVGEIQVCSVIDYTPVLCISTLAERPALALAKTGTQSAMICDELTYTLRVTNTGTGVARNVRVQDNLPEGVTTTDGRNSVTYEVAALAAGESKEFTFNAKATRTGTFTNNATAAAEGDLSARSQDVVTVVCQPVLEVTVTGIERTFVGRQITFNGSVTNTGDCASQNTVVTMAVPQCTVFASASGNGSHAAGVVTWNVGALEPGQTRNVALTVQADEICVARTTIAAEGVCADRVTAQAQTELVGVPAVLLEVIDVEDPILVGSIEEFIIVVTNQGTAVDTNISIVLELEMFEHVSNSGPTAGTVEGNRVTFAPLPRLEPKAKAEWRVRARALEAGDIRTRVIMNTSELGRPVEETEATRVYE